MECRILGVLEVFENGLPVALGGPKQRAVLAMLLLEPNRVVSSDRLVEGLWDADPPLRAAATLQVYVSNLRKALEPGRAPRAESSMLRHQSPGYVLTVDPSQVDLFQFEHLVGTARRLASAGRVAGAASLLREGLGLWREAPLADLVDEPFARFEVPRLEEARLGTIEDRIDADLSLGRHVELVAELEALVVRHPFRERLWSQLMLARYRAGRQADALGAYQAARDALVEGLGLEPGRELRELEAAVLVHDPSLQLDEPAPLTADDVMTVLAAIDGQPPSEALVAQVVAEGAESARRGADALDHAIEHRRAVRLTTTLDAADATRIELTRTRRVLTEGILDRRRMALATNDVISREAANGPARDLCPYRGLLPFEPEDAAWYFGREQLAAQALATMASAPCTALVGASGSGKSSLMRAGLLAPLRHDALPGSAGWPTLLMVPGTDPLFELAKALAPLCHATSANHVRDRLLDDPESFSGFATRALDSRAPQARLLVVVDQLEELFTVCRDDSLRDRFLDVLVEGMRLPDAQVRVVTAVRADYLSHCAVHDEFAALAASDSILVGPMSALELQRAIEMPAARAGLDVEPGLVDRIFHDAGTEPGALPLIETALLETWRHRDDSTLTIDAYEHAGGVTGAVARMADEVYEHFSPEQRTIARGLFLRLAETGVDDDDVRRRAPLAELIADDDQAAVLSTLVERRLVVTSDATAEVAHEAILREWPTLRGWLDEDREGRRVHRAISIGAQDWEAASRNDDLLFRGTRLAAAIDVADAGTAEINPLERDFLGASRARQDIELQSAQRTTHRLRLLTGTLAMLLVIALAAGTFSLVQLARADRSADRAERAARLSDAQRLVAQADALGADEHDLRLLLTAEAYRLAPGPETESGLFRAVTTEPGNDERMIVFDTETIFGAAISPDGTLLAVADPGGLVRILDTRTKREVRQFSTPPDSQAVAPVFSSDGRWLSVGSVGGSVTVWDVSNGRSVAGPLGSPTGLAYGVFDPTSRHRLYIAGHDGVVSVWDLSDATRAQSNVLVTTAPITSPSNPLAVLPARDGRRLTIGDFDPIRGSPILVVDATTGNEVARFEGAPGGISPDGRFVARRRPDNATEVLDVASAVGTRISGIVRPAGLMSFDTTGARLAVADEATGQIHVVDWRTGLEVGTPITFAGNPQFLADGRLFIRGNQRSALVDLTIGDAKSGSILRPIARRFSAGGVVFGRDGSVVTTSNNNVSIVVSDADDPSRQRTFAVPERLRGRFVGPSPDHRLLLTFRRPGGASDPNLELEVVERATGKSLGSFTRAVPGYNYSWSYDSAALWLTNNDGVYLWRIGEPSPRRLSGPVDPPVGGALPQAVAFRPDGRELLHAISATGTAASFRVAGNGQRRKVFDDATVEMRGGVTYWPDGRGFAVATFDNRAGASRVFVFDDRTGKVIDRYVFDHPIANMAYLNSGRRLATIREATGGQDSPTTMLEVWDTNTLTTTAAIPLQGFARLLVPSPDGTHLMIFYAGISSEQSVTVWDMRPASWLQHACQAAGRSLTRAEWKQYLEGLPYAPVCD